ncbi:MAG: hypothetical protein CMJ81_06235 [Planctomycetaceae bacterium]|nr:hypothetical protein [Planctomycetaceae bacterium]MBP60518.1 hypothetical protein [Planctomycetaceae bacterium]
MSGLAEFELNNGEPVAALSAPLAAAGLETPSSTTGDRATRNQQAADTYVGRVQQVEEDGQIRVENSSGQWETFQYNNKTQVTDAQGNKMPIDETEGLRVRVTYKTVGGKQVAEKIEVLRHQFSATGPRALSNVESNLTPSGSGTQTATTSETFVGRVQQVEEDGQIRVENSRGQWETFQYNDKTQVTDAQGNKMSIDETEGLRVRVTYKTMGGKQVAEKIEVLGHQLPGSGLRTLRTVENSASPHGHSIRFVTDQSPGAETTDSPDEAEARPSRNQPCSEAHVIRQLFARSERNWYL